MNHLVETANLCCTAAADHILPFTLAPHLWTVVLPTLGVPGDSNFRTADANALRLSGRINTAGWLEWAERQWKKLRKASEKTSLHQRLDYLSQLSAQAKQLRFVIIFIAAGKRPVACTIDTTDLALPFVARDRTFWASFNSFQEPFYLAALFNSDYGAAAIVDWMNKGQFGLRDMNKRILDVPWPRFDSKNDSHIRLADLSRELSEQASQLVKALPSADTGRRRAMLRGRLNSTKRAQIETLVSKMMKP